MRNYVAAGVGALLGIILLVAPKLGIESKWIDLSLGAAIAWAGQIVTFYFRKREAG